MNVNPPAFPSACMTCDAKEPGMSLRDYFAGQAIIGLLAFPIMTEVPPHERILSIPDLAQQAFEVADAMIEAEKVNP